MNHDKNTQSIGLQSAAALLVVGAFIGLTLLSAIAHSDESHKKNDSHMQAMLEVKKRIPEEYRIMDRTPVTPVPQSLERGQKLYARHCAVCHGRKGAGGPAAASKAPPANFLDLEHSAVYGPGEKYWLIGNGSGKTGMPAFAQLGPEERWHLVNFILSLQEKVRKMEHGH